MPLSSAPPGTDCQERRFSARRESPKPLQKKVENSASPVALTGYGARAPGGVVSHTRGVLGIAERIGRPVYRVRVSHHAKQAVSLAGGGRPGKRLRAPHRHLCAVVARTSGDRAEARTQSVGDSLFQL